MSIEAIIVDDEPLARQRLSRMLGELDISVIAQGSNGREAVQLNAQHDVDIVFLDINMPIQNGLEAAREIVKKQDRPPAIIFCTAYDEYALEAFGANAAAYLLKPINLTDLRTAIDKAQSVSRIQVETWLSQQNEQSDSFEKLAVKQGTVTEYVPSIQFVYFLTIDKNVYAKRIDMPEMLVDYTLKEVEKLLAGSLLRIHRNCLVNPAYLQKMNRSGVSSAKVSLLHTDKEFDVSRRHLKQVKECFQ